MRRGCWRGNVILVFKCMKDYYCFIDAGSSEPPSLYHFPGLLIYCCGSSRPSSKWINLTCASHYSHPTQVSDRLCSLSLNTNVCDHWHSATLFHMSTFSPSSRPCWGPTFSINFPLAWVWISFLPATNSTHVLYTYYVSGTMMFAKKC